PAAVTNSSPTVRETVWGPIFGPNAGLRPALQPQKHTVPPKRLRTLWATRTLGAIYPMKQRCPSPPSILLSPNVIAEWFASRFPTVTEPQRLGWPEIRSGNDVLISAPTGSGKTLAAFLI